MKSTKNFILKLESCQNKNRRKSNITIFNGGVLFNVALNTLITKFCFCFLNVFIFKRFFKHVEEVKLKNIFSEFYDDRHMILTFIN